MANQRVAPNKVVTVSYSIMSEAGEILERVDLPVNYVHGGGSGLFDKVELALDGQKVGDTVEVTLTPEEGFGPWNPEMTFRDAIDNVPPEFRRVGAEAEFSNADGGTIKMVVTSVADGMVILDGNHPFAGKTVKFVVTIDGVRDATSEEIRSRQTENMPGIG